MLSSKRACCVIAVAALCISLSSVALALSALPVSRPDRIPFSATYPASAQRQVGAALSPVGGKFIDGMWCNGKTTLRYSGDTTSLNRMVGLLADCPEVTVEVSFRKIDNACDWQIIHEIRPNLFRVIVNLKSETVRLEELKIPTSNGPELKP